MTPVIIASLPIVAIVVLMLAFNLQTLSALLHGQTKFNCSILVQSAGLCALCCALAVVFVLVLILCGVRPLGL